MAFFKKKTEETSTQPTAPFELEPKISAVEGAAPSPSAAPRPQLPPTGGALGGEAGFDRFGKLRSALGPGTVIQGKLSFDTPVRIDGRLSGEIFSSQAIIVGAGGSIEGDIEVSTLVVLGTVRGKVRAHERVEILQGGRLEADFTAPVFTIEEGGFFNGRASMGGGGASPKLEVRGDAATPMSGRIAGEAASLRGGDSSKGAVVIQ